MHALSYWSQHCWRQLSWSQGRWLIWGLCAVGLLHWPQTPVAQAGQTVVVVLDDSGSMDRRVNRMRKIDAAQMALRKVLESLPHDTQVGILALNSKVSGSHWIVPVGSPDVPRWSSALDQIRAKGGTDLGQRMRQGADELLKLRAQKPYDTYRLLVVTDGEATDAPLLASIMPDLMSRGLNVDVIGVAMDQAHSLAKSAHTYRTAADAATLTQALSDVFAETNTDAPGSQADFDLIAGLQEEVAREVVRGLTAPRNDPLQTLDEINAQIPSDAGGGTPPAVPPNFPPAQPQSSRGTVTWFLSSLCCFGMLTFVGLVVLSIILGAVKNKTMS